MRQFVKFDSKREGTELEVYCYNLDPKGEVDEVTSILTQRGFALTSVDSDSVCAKKQGNYIEMIKDMIGLKEKGFSWDID